MFYLIKLYRTNSCEEVQSPDYQTYSSMQKHSKFRNSNFFAGINSSFTFNWPLGYGIWTCMHETTLYLPSREFFTAPNSRLKNIWFEPFCMSQKLNQTKFVKLYYYFLHFILVSYKIRIVQHNSAWHYLCW